MAGRATGIGVGDRHRLARLDALDALVVLARNVIDVRADVVDPVVLPILASILTFTDAEPVQPDALLTVTL